MEQGRLKFLADENISPVLIRILHHAGEKSILRFTTNFPNGTPDEVWIPEATARGFICVTLDRKMLTSSALAAFFAQKNARVIFIGNHLANTKPWDQALWLLKYWPKIRGHAAGMKPGDLVRVLKNGRIVTVVAQKP